MNVSQSSQPNDINKMQSRSFPQIQDGGYENYIIDFIYNRIFKNLKLYRCLFNYACLQTLVNNNAYVVKQLLLQITI